MLPSGEVAAPGTSSTRPAYCGHARKILIQQQKMAAFPASNCRFHQNPRHVGVVVPPPVKRGGLLVVFTDRFTRRAIQAPADFFVNEVLQYAMQVASCIDKPFNRGHHESCEIVACVEVDWRWGAGPGAQATTHSTNLKQHISAPTDDLPVLAV
jgi:hypothetical protein